MHVHISMLSAVITSLYVVIFAFFWRLVSAHMSETNVGKAMSFIF